MLRILVLSSLVLAVAGAGCSSTTCGEGTVLVGGECVLDTAYGKCTPGTKLINGECKIVCAPGTKAGTAGCVPAEDACAVGTELKEGKCVPLDPMGHITEPEAAEPNDTALTAKRFVLPGVGQDAKVLGGVVEAQQNGDPDYDGWVFTATALTRIRVEAVAVGVPSVGVVVERVEGPGIKRLVASLDSRDASRLLTLPAAGDYLIRVTEASNLLPGSRTRGGASFTYIINVTQLSAPAVKNINSDGSAAGAWADGDLLDIPGSGDTQIFEVKLTTEGDAAFAGLRGLWGVDADGRTTLTAADTLSSSTGSVIAMDVARLVVPPTGAKLLVDPVIVFPAGLAQRYGIKLVPVEVREAPGTTLTGDLDDPRVHIYSIDLEDGSVVTAEPYDIGYDVEVRVALYDSTFTLIGETTSEYDDAVGIVMPGRGGRCFVVIEDRDADPSDRYLDYDVRLKIEKGVIVPRLDVPGTASATMEAPASGGAWFILTASRPGIARLQLTATGGSFSVERYNESLASAGSTVSSTNGVATVDRMPVSAGRATLVRVRNATGQITLDAETREAVYVAEREPNDTSDAANVVTLGSDGSASLNGRIKDADVDLFRVDVAGPLSRLAAETDVGLDGSKPDTNLRLLDENGDEIDENDDVSSSSSNYFSAVEGTNIAAGTYFIEVKYPGYASGGKGDKGYTLYITTTP